MVFTGIQVLWEIIFLDWAAKTKQSFYSLLFVMAGTNFSRYKCHHDAKNTNKTDNLINSFNHDSSRYRYILVEIKMR